MFEWDSFRGVTLRALLVDYISPRVCFLQASSSGSGSGDSATLDILPVARRDGPTNLQVVVSGSLVTLTWDGQDYIYSYAVYLSSVSAEGPFVLLTSNEQDETFSYTSFPGTFWTKVTGIEETAGETFASNTVQFTVT